MGSTFTKNAAANQASHADQPVTNDSPSAVINSLASKNSKISDVKKHQKEPLFLTPHEDPPKPDFKNSPVGVKWPGDNSVLIDNSDLPEPASLHEDSLPLRKQKVFNILTESFETPDSSIIGDLNLSTLLNTRDQCELGQDPLSVIVETDANLNQNLSESNQFYSEVSNLLSGASENNILSNVSYVLNKTTDLEPFHDITKEDIENGNFEIAQDEGIAVVNSDEREDILKACEINIKNLEDNTFSLDSKILNTSDFLHKDLELEIVTKLNNTFDMSVPSTTMNNLENEESTMQNPYVLSNSMHLNNNSDDFEADISNNIIEHLKEISDVRKSINNLLASANNSMQLNESTNNSRPENIDSEGIAVIEDENSNKSELDNNRECVPIVDQSHHEVCGNISQSSQDTENNKIEVEVIQSTNNSMQINDAVDVTSDVSTTEEVQINRSPENMNLNQSHNSSAGLLDPSFINETDSIIGGTYNADEPMDCDFEASYVIQANLEATLPLVDKIGTITQQIDLNPFETKTSVANTPDRHISTSTLSNSIVVEGTRADELGDTSEPMECDESFSINVAITNVISNTSSLAPNNSREASDFDTRSIVSNSPAIEKTVEGNNSLTEADGFGTRSNVCNSPAIEKTVKGNDSLTEANSFGTRSNVCNSPGIEKTVEGNNSLTEADGFGTRSNVCNSPAIEKSVEGNDSLTEANAFGTRSNVCNSPTIEKTIERNIYLAESSGFDARANVQNSPAQVIEHSSYTKTNESLTETNCFVTKANACNSPAQANENISSLETSNPLSESNGFETKSNIFNTPVKNTSEPPSQEGVIPEANLSESKDGNPTSTEQELVSNGVGDIEAARKSPQICNSNESMYTDITITISAPSPHDESKNLPKHEDISTVNENSTAVVEASSKINTTINAATFETDKSTEQVDSDSVSIDINTINASSDSIAARHFKADQNLSEVTAILNVTEASPNLTADIYLKADQALDEASDILESMNTSIPIVQRTEAEINATFNADVSISHVDPPSEVALEVQSNAITSEDLNSIISKFTDMAMDNTFEVKDNIESNVPSDIIESEILDNDFDGLESDSDTISACSSVPSEFNPFETRCKIKNTPDREIDTTIRAGTNLPEVETPLDSTLVIEKKAIKKDVKKDLSKTANQTTNKTQTSSNTPDSVSQSMSNILTDDQCNANISSFNMSIANGDFVKNSTSFKHNLERINDVSPDNIDTTPKSANIARSDSCKQNTSDHTFASPVPRRVNQLSKKNTSVKVQKVKNLSPMSRCGDLMGMSPVAHDGEERGNASPQDKAADFLTGDSNFQYSNVIDDNVEDEFKVPGELFKDPAAFDYLLTCGTGGGRDLCKESLLVRFDPLVGTRGAQLPTGPRPGRHTQEDLPPPPPKLEEDASPASGLAESCSSDSSLCISNSEPGKTLGTMSSIDQSMSALSLQSQGAQQHSAANCSTPPSVASNVLNVTSQPTEKPTQVVTPAISTRQQYLPSTPLSSKNPQTPQKSVTSALAAIDRLISLGGTPPPPPVVVQPKEPDMDPRLMAELQSVRELFSHQEEELRHTNDKMSSLQKQLNDAIAREQALIDRVNEKNRDHRQMDMVMEEYERTMSQFIGDRESEKRQWGEERAALIRERDEANSHLANMEHSFNDIHAKYERCKQLVQGYKNNEDDLKEAARLNDEATKKQAERYEQLRQHAMSQLETANAEIETLKKSSSSEVIKLQAMLKKSDIQVASLQESLSQKIKDIEDLTAICDDLIQKVG